MSEHTCPTKTMRLSDFVRVFKDDLGDMLKENLKVLGDKYEDLKTRYDSAMAQRKPRFIAAMQEYKVPREEWELYWMMVDLADWDTTQIKNKLSEVSGYLNNIMNAYRIWKHEMGLASDENEIDVDTARQTPIESLVVGKITKAGKFLKTCCPLHGEKTPSFFIYPDNTFYCYGCGKGGDVISFVQELDNISFPEAVRRLVNGL